MIYVPNSTFRTDIADGGFVVAHSDSKYPNNLSAVEVLKVTQEVGVLCNIDMTQLASKFKLAGQSPPSGEHLVYGFVREDGCEFAISPYQDFCRVSFIGYWIIPFKLRPSEWRTYGLIWLPNQMIDFIFWVDELCPLK